jgi:Immunity protein 35
MLTFQEARQIAQAEISKHKFSDDNSLIIVDEEIIEKEYAWIFPYTSKKYWETKDILYAVGGNGPLFISKLDGQVSNYRTGLSIEGMIDEHKERNKLWELLLTEEKIETNSMLTLKNALNWTQQQFVEFRKNQDMVLDLGSKSRLSQIQSQLLSSGLKTTLILAK